MLRRWAAPARGVSIPVACGAVAMGIGAFVASYANGAAWWLAALSGLASTLGAIAAAPRRR